MISSRYSQYGEDDYLINFFLNKNDGFLVDIGAADGVRYSNSRLLIQLGWYGLLVEPNPKNFQKLQILYNENKKILLENVGCSDVSNNISEFFIDKNDDYEQLSTFSLDQVLKCKKLYNCEFVKETVKIIKTSDLFEKHQIKKINFLSIDTEAFDTKVISGIDFHKYEIDLICVEHESDEMKKILFENNYEISYKTIGNSFFKKKK